VLCVWGGRGHGSLGLNKSADLLSNAKSEGVHDFFFFKMAAATENLTGWKWLKYF
jgi:hypothetical protein